jgi:hypothetical protein
MTELLSTLECRLSDVAGVVENPFQNLLDEVFA